MARHELSYAPRLLSANEAAAYLGLSATTLRELPIPRKVLGRRKLWDRMDLDAYANELPYDGTDASEDEEKACDRAFGLSD
jgi:hypothetical protein